MNDWSILIFTLLIQTSIGASIFFSYLYFTNKLTVPQNDNSDSVLLKPFSMLLALSIIGLIASFGHLGYPLNAINSIRNIFSSWLSREIILTSGYIGLLGMIVLSLYFKRFIKFVPLLLILASVIGLLDIYVMGSIYKATSIITWKSNYTYILFSGTALILGASIVLTLLKNSLIQNNNLFLFAKKIIVLMIIYALFELMFLPFYIIFIQNHSYNEIVTFPIDSTNIYLNNINLQIYRYIILGIGLSTMAWGIFKKKTQYLYFALGIVVIAEVIGRYTFYNIH